MKKYFIISFFCFVFVFSVTSQQRVLVEREGTRTAQSTPFPVLFEEKSPSDLQKLGGWYTLPWAPQPPSTINDTIKDTFYYFINYVSYFALNDEAAQRQVERFLSEIQTRGEYILTITDANANVVSQFSVKINILPSGMHQPVVKFIFPHRVIIEVFEIYFLIWAMSLEGEIFYTSLYE
jgi:hypothetical protein